MKILRNKQAVALALFCIGLSSAMITRKAEAISWPFGKAAQQRKQIKTLSKAALTHAQAQPNGLLALHQQFQAHATNTAHDPAVRQHFAVQAAHVSTLMNQGVDAKGIIKNISTNLNASKKTTEAFRTNLLTLHTAHQASLVPHQAARATEHAQMMQSGSLDELHSAHVAAADKHLATVKTLQTKEKLSPNEELTLHVAEKNLDYHTQQAANVASLGDGAHDYHATVENINRYHLLANDHARNPTPGKPAAVYTPVKLDELAKAHAKANPEKTDGIAEMSEGPWFTPTTYRHPDSESNPAPTAAEPGSQEEQVFKSTKPWPSHGEDVSTAAEPATEAQVRPAKPFTMPTTKKDPNEIARAKALSDEHDRKLAEHENTWQGSQGPESTGGIDTPAASAASTPPQTTSWESYNKTQSERVGRWNNIKPIDLTNP